jgi:hypothetical protein
MAHFSNWEEFKKAMDRLHEETVRLRQQIELDYQRWRAEMEAWKTRSIQAVEPARSSAEGLAEAERILARYKR